MEAVFLGAGSLGSALVKRLASQGVKVVVWNRTHAKSVAAVADTEGARAVADLAEALASPGPVLACLSNFRAIQETLAPLSASLDKRCLVTLSSGTPEDARQFAADVKDWPVRAFLSASFAGSPKAAVAGNGIIMWSCTTTQEVLEQDPDSKYAMDVTAQLGRFVCTGTTLGSEKALDYAVVDLYAYNAMALISGLALCEAEGVPQERMLELFQARYGVMPDLLAGLLPNLNSRDYTQASASLSTFRAFFSERIPYMKSRGMGTPIPEFMASLMSSAAGPSDEHASEDVTRLQEVLRAPSDK